MQKRLTAFFIPQTISQTVTEVGNTLFKAVLF